AGGGQRRAERDDVGGHVPGVGQQRQRLRPEARDQLDEEEAADEDEGDRQPPAVPAAQVGAAVGVAHRSPAPAVGQSTTASPVAASSSSAAPRTRVTASGWATAYIEARPTGREVTSPQSRRQARCLET